MAVEKSNATIVKLLLDSKNIDINTKSLFNSYYIHEHPGYRYHIYYYEEKYFFNKLGLQSKINNFNEEEYNKDVEEYYQHDFKYHPINSHYEESREFSLGEMTPLQLAEEQGDKDIIALLSK